ncbi:hypothetical protein FA15DRAFT_153958 [Coprinopsis marcescibilis]|uniref:Uncharacterized protein n=1 Tax=Coprinopsis marcescibilis TaxID=230819 RepID=A0A5C3KI63_COPMA|nr:hypothetical protein FA15DRAFT_153958 [Coprinopsis marcescibilis]
MAGPDFEFNFEAQRAKDLTEQVYMLAGFWVETLLYGIYVVLFIGSVKLMIKRRSERHPPSKIVFITLIILMFVLTTYWTGVNVYRFIRAYALMIMATSGGPFNLPIHYFRFFATWDNFSYVIVSSLLFWMADFLAIYRCYIIWERSRRVVALPFLLLLVSIGTNGVNFHFFLYGPRGGIPFRTVKPLLDFVYPGHLAQNVLTTGLIAYKIWKRHVVSQAAGVRASSTVTLLSVARIVVESAMLYTLQMLALVILHPLEHPARLVFQAAIVPSTGIVFVLISIRVHLAVEEKAEKAPATSVLFPSWAHASEMEENGPSMSRTHSLISMLHPSLKRDEALRGSPERRYVGV